MVRQRVSTFRSPFGVRVGQFFECKHQPSTNDKSVWFGSIIAMVPLVYGSHADYYGKNCNEFFFTCEIDRLFIDSCAYLCSLLRWILLPSILKFKLCVYVVWILLKINGNVSIWYNFGVVYTIYLRQINLLINYYDFLFEIYDV